MKPETNSPVVSVVMAVFNGEKFIDAAVNSIFAQTFNNFELVVVNDGSTDGTLTCLQAVTDERLRIVSNASNLGLAKSLNVGIAASRGRYIARQDADDVSLPERLQMQFNYMEAHPQIALLGTGRKTKLSDGRLKAGAPPLAHPTFDDMLYSNRIVGASVMIRKQVLDAVGGYDDFFRQSDDYDLWLRVMEQYAAANLPEDLYVVTRNVESLSRGNAGVSLLYRLLAINRAKGVVSPQVMAQVKGDGIESYYELLSDEDKIFYHQRVAKRCMNYHHNQEALQHYRLLLKLQGWRLKTLWAMLKIKFRLFFKSGGRGS